MTRRKYPSEDQENPGWTDRLITAILAPIFFNVAVLIVLFTFLGKSRSLKLAPWRGLPSSVAMISAGIIFLGLPFIVGFLGGSSKFAKILGHSFLTNPPHEQNAVITFGIWASIFLSALALSKILSM